jgi:hypothetical protein
MAVYSLTRLAPGDVRVVQTGIYAAFFISTPIACTSSVKLSSGIDSLVEGQYPDGKEETGVSGRASGMVLSSLD